MKHVAVWGIIVAAMVGCGNPQQASQEERLQDEHNGLKHWDGNLVQHGEMHVVIGQQQHEGRIQLKKAVERPDLFAVGALSELSGEFTIYDGKVYATQVEPTGEISAADSAGDLQAALLVGCHVPEWTEHKITDEIGHEDLEKYIERTATKCGIDTSRPFPFTISGELHGLEFHVIHGACPVHSKRNGVELSDDKVPYHSRHKRIEGTLVGVFAKNAAGNITHPGTSTHTHVIFQHGKTEEKVTGHVEKVGVAKGAVLHLPRL